MPRGTIDDLPASIRRRRPLIALGVADNWPARVWTLESLGREYGDVRAKIARLEGGEVQRHHRRGLLFDERPLGPFVESVSRGAATGYLMTRIDELPAPMREALPTPAGCADGRRRISKLWISGAGVVSALHFDVQNNLHTVLAGAKRFVLYAPRDTLCVYPCGPLSSVPNGARVDPEAPDFARHPRFARAHGYLADIRSGETLFVPAGWWHHVRSLEHSIAVNTWWAEGALRALAAAADLFKRARGISR